MKVTAVHITRDGEVSRVVMATEDSRGNTAIYQYSGEVSTSYRSSGKSFVSIEVTVARPRKREPVEDNLPSHRFDT